MAGETLAHLRVFTGSSRAEMGRELGMAEATYREPETTGRRGRLACGRYSYEEGWWVAWQEWAPPKQEWAPPKFGVTAERLASAEQRTREEYEAERERRWQRLREADPASAARIEELGRALRGR